MSEKTERKLHSWRTVALPVFIALLVIVIFLLAIALPGSLFRLNHIQLSTVGNWLITVMILCPLVICMVIPYALLVGLIYLMQRAHKLSETGLSRARGLTHTAALKGVGLADTANQKTIAISTRFAFLNHVFESRIDERTERNQLEKPNLSDGNP